MDASTGWSSSEIGETVSPAGTCGFPTPPVLRVVRSVCADVGVLVLRYRAPRGAFLPCGDERAPQFVCRSRRIEAEGSLAFWNEEVGWEAALTTPGRVSTVRWFGSG